jgi:hypothetical protein
MIAAVLVQVLLLIYHQLTTWLDLHPFNGARHYSRAERFAEAGVNALLMSLAPIGFACHIKSLMTIGVVYYYVLFVVELIIWWLPYLVVPSGRWRAIYNLLLSVATSSFEKGDTLERWVRVHHRLHHGTITFLPVRPGRPVPNLEHTILHVWTLVTVVVTSIAYFCSR